MLAWHYHDDDVSGPEAAIDLAIGGLPLENGEMKFRHFRIDEEHSNAFALWKRMGSPQQPTADQYARLEKAGQLAELQEPQTLRVAGAKINLKFRLPRQAVSLLVIE